MSKEDRYGAIAAIVCGGMAWVDENWRPFWLTCGVALSVWTLMSLTRRS